jgi:hypothetical protein
MLISNQEQLRMKDREIGLIQGSKITQVSENKSFSKSKGIKEGCIMLNRKDKLDNSPNRSLSPTPNKKKISLTGKEPKQETTLNRTTSNNMVN